MPSSNADRQLIPGFSNGAGASLARAEAPAPSDEDIARRAYEKFLSRGEEHGFDRDDWLDARRDLMAEALAIGRPHDGQFDA